MQIFSVPNIFIVAISGRILTIKEAHEKDVCDLEIDEMRRTIQERQQHLDVMKVVILLENPEIKGMSVTLSIKM